MELEALEADLKNVVALKDEEIERLKQSVSGTTKEELETLEAELKRVTQDRDNLLIRLGNGKIQASEDDRHKIRQLEARVTELDNTNWELEKRYSEVNELWNRSEKKRTELQAQLEEQKPDYQTIANRVLASLKLGTQSPQYKSARKALSQFVAALTTTEESTPSSQQTLTHKEMMLRLGVPTSTLSQWKLKDDFLSLSKQRDPEGISWQWDEGIKRFIPAQTTNY